MGPADLILEHGPVITLDRRGAIAQAVAVTGDRIAAVGRPADVASLAGPHTRRVDLGGRALVPGLVDAHAHMDREGLKALCPTLAGCRSIDDVLDRVRALVREAAPGAWIVTMPLGDPPYYLGLPEELRERRFPTRHDLDRAAPDHPVYIRPIWGYWRHTLPLVSIANSRALERAGITRDTVPPWEGIEIDRDAGGEPTGIFVERTFVPIVELTLLAAAPRFTHADRVAALGRSMAIYAASGTTAVFEGHGVAGEVEEAYRTLHARGALTVRAHLVRSPSWSTVGAPGTGRGAALARAVASWADTLGGGGSGDAWLRMSGLTVELGPTPDNVLRARARPYTGWAGFSYDAGLPRDELRDVLLAAARAGIRCCIMSADLLDLYEAVDRVVPIGGRRWVLEHVSTLDAQQIRRIRDLGLVVTTHTNRYIAKEGELLRARVGPEREDTIVPLRSLLEAAVPVALATDNVPPSLFHPIWQAVARLDRASGRPVAPAQRLSRVEALRAASAAGAYLTFDEDARGTIEAGKLADLAVLSANPLTVDEGRLPEIAADLTIVGGRIVHERAPAAGARGPW